MRREERKREVKSQRSERRGKGEGKQLHYILTVCAMLYRYLDSKPQDSLTVNHWIPQQTTVTLR